MAGKEKPQQGINIGRLPIETLPRDLQGSGKTFQRLALGMQSLPKSISAAYETDISPLLEQLPDTSPQIALVSIFTDPTTIDALIDFYAMGAELDTSVRSMDNATMDIISKSTKGKKQMPGNIKGVVNTMLQVIETADYVNPLDALPQGSPSLVEMGRANIESEDFSRDFSDAKLTVFQKLPSLFRYTGDPEQETSLAFLTYLAANRPEPIDAERRTALRQKKVSAETLHTLNQAGSVLAEYFDSYLLNFTLRSYGYVSYDRADTHPMPTKQSLLSAVLGLYSLTSYETSDYLPSSYAALLDSGFIPFLDPDVAERLKHVFTEKFYQKYPDLLQKTDERGNQPYQGFDIWWFRLH